MSRSRHRAVPLALVTGAVLLAAPALAAPAASGPRQADAIPLPVTVGNNQCTGGTGYPDQTQWYEVALKKGHDYAFWAFTGGLHPGPAFTVYGPSYGPGGKPLLSFPSGDFTAPSGGELRAPSTGTYKVAAIGGAGGYCLGVEFDCRQGPNTTCTLAVGRKSRGYFAFEGDQDWRRIAVQAGRHYSLLLWGHGEATADAAVLGRRGKVVAGCSADDQARQPCLGFTAAYSGPYYVSVRASGEEGSYDIGLTSP